LRGRRFENEALTLEEGIATDVIVGNVILVARRDVKNEHVTLAARRARDSSFCD
jgi:hypothetical protein